MMRYAEMRLSGSGGQGLGLAGRIIAEAAITEDYNVCQTQSYGPEARGGSSRTDIIISRDEILFPNCRELDLLLAMNQESCSMYSSSVKDGGLIVVDSTFVDQLPAGNVYALALTTEAVSRFGNALMANMLALGMVSSLVSFFKPETWRKAVGVMVPARFYDVNLKAFDLGVEMGGELVKDHAVRKPVAFDRKQPVPECLRRRPKQG